MAFVSTQPQRWHSTRAGCWGPPLGPAINEMLVLRGRGGTGGGARIVRHLSSDLGKQRFYSMARNYCSLLRTEVARAAHTKEVTTLR